MNSSSIRRVPGTGAKAALMWLRRKHIRRFIYSNHNIPNIHRQLVRLKLLPFIDAVLARRQDDHPQVYERSKGRKLFAHLKQLKIKPNEVVSVGDSEEKIEIGKTYGYHTVAITGDYNSAARLKKHHFDFLIHNLKDLIFIVKKLRKSQSPCL